MCCYIKWDSLHMLSAQLEHAIKFPDSYNHAPTLHFVTFLSNLRPCHSKVAILDAMHNSLNCAYVSQRNEM